MAVKGQASPEVERVPPQALEMLRAHPMNLIFSSFFQIAEISVDRKKIEKILETSTLMENAKNSSFFLRDREK